MKKWKLFHGVWNAMIMFAWIVALLSVVFKKEFNYSSIAILICCGVIFLASSNRINKNLTNSDEMFKKIGYTSLSVSFQLLMLISGILYISNMFYPFLEKYTVENILLGIILLWIILLMFSFRYYSHNPDKTGL